MPSHIVQNNSGCGNFAPAGPVPQLNNNTSQGTQAPFTFTRCEGNQEQEWADIKSDVRTKITLLRCIWRGKGSKTLLATPDFLRGKEYEDHVGKPLNVSGILRCDMLILFSVASLIYFGIGVYLFIFSLSETSAGRIHISLPEPFQENGYEFALSAGLLVLASAAVFMIVVFLPWVIALRERREKFRNKATEAIRDFLRTDILGDWVDDMRAARELLSFGMAGGIPQTSANNAIRAISRWRRLEQFGGKTVSPFTIFADAQVEFRQLICGVAALLFMIALAFFVGYLFLENQHNALDYFLAQELLLIFCLCLAAAAFTVVVFGLFLLGEAKKAAVALKSALAGDPLFAAAKFSAQSKLSALETALAKLDPYCLLVARYQAALETIDEMK